ncbi:cytochrome aa3 quinol oxidase subunit II [Tuberibacillus sp. Marseille-P3662]|uniref:cytochrome aa3 quinol oxidase subunit II n=1 Tax=Tuberibacillus sp. Marseille-P3662 TaxID=1965358 RepID=UPI000A1CD7AF|nr:cytochrome aa3 quinol oxidase subunit II [Tuberibacillus sp. Marseille-P3662]
MLRRLIKSGALLTILTLMLSGCSWDNVLVLSPDGPVADRQKELIMWSFYLVMGIVVVVFALFTYIVWKFRNRSGEKHYDPEYEGNKKLEFIWTGIPIIIVILLAIPTVTTTFDLKNKPEKYEDAEPLTIKVIAADWKWVFQYPEQGIQTVNYLHIPEERPVNFVLTSAGSMCSFWIPELGGQKYAMSGMKTNLWLAADDPGVYLGQNANFSGEGYTHMKFKVYSQTESNFDQWVKNVKQDAPDLSKDKFDDILKPGLAERMTFSSYPKNFDFVMRGGSELYEQD